ncbi:MAG TPA: class I SAM-dependent methyltransferase [Micromonosporaceae bacterium]
MTIAPDGSPVALYRRLPPRTGDAELVHGLLPPGGRVLDLGCGTGRLAEPLARLGHPVTGVDNEPDMLAELRLARPVPADLATVDLGERFHAVLLMSHLVNTADPTFVAAALRTVRRHVRDDGFAVVERHAPGWVATCAPSVVEVDGVRYTLTDLDRRDDVLTATVRYEFDGQRVDHPFSVRDVTDERLTALAATAGLRFDSTLDDSGRLALLRPRMS